MKRSPGPSPRDRLPDSAVPKPPPRLRRKNTLQRAAVWLRQHHEARILIVGSCDANGSETCTHALAEARGGVIQKFLGSYGIDSNQIVGVKGWDNLEKGCQTSDVVCQQSNRNARIFMAGTVAP